MKMFDEICKQGAVQACSTLGAPHTCVVQMKAIHMRRGTLIMVFIHDLEEKNC